MINVGLVGLGMAIKPHMQSVRELETAGRIKFAGGFSPSAERRAAFTKQWNAPALDTQDELIAKSDLVLILTPPWTHLPLAEAIDFDRIRQGALENGVIALVGGRQMRPEGAADPKRSADDTCSATRRSASSNGSTITEPSTTYRTAASTDSVGTQEISASAIRRIESR